MAGVSEGVVEFIAQDWGTPDNSWEPPQYIFVEI